MIVKPNITNEEFFSEVATSTKKATMYNIKFGLFNKPIFKLDMCVIKYPLGRFDKITFEHQNEEFINELNKNIKNALGVDAKKYVEIKGNELAVKVTKLSREKAENVNKYDVVDFLIEFNNCWLMDDKIYTSFILKDLKESEEKITHEAETPFLFTDIEEQ